LDCNIIWDIPETKGTPKKTSGPTQGILETFVLVKGNKKRIKRNILYLYLVNGT